MIRACLLNERTSMREYIGDLKAMASEKVWFEEPATVLRVADVPELKHEPNTKLRMHTFDEAKLLTSKTSRLRDTSVSGQQLWPVPLIASD